MHKPKIYFGASIRAGRDDATIYAEILAHLQTIGTVLTEHVGDTNLRAQGEQGISDESIHNRDLAWIEESDIVIVEATQPSLGVGYEMRYAVDLAKPVLVLHRLPSEKRLSAMIAGCKPIMTRSYSDLDEARHHIDTFLKTITPFRH